MSTQNLDTVIATLNQHQQRATYSAVAELVGQAPRSLMKGKPREQSNSWIVSKHSGVPTGYGDTEVHPDLKKNDVVLKTKEELEAWLQARGAM